VRKALERVEGISNDVEFSEYLIEHAGVALVPGSAFGLAGHVRLSIATSMDNLRNALDRLERVLSD
jgi:aspartate aminotransferase